MRADRSPDAVAHACARPGRLLGRAGLVLVALLAAGAGSARARQQPVPASIAAVCGRAGFLCVDDTPGAGREYATIQEAVDAAGPGDTVLVFDGEYAGFRVRRGGRPGSPLRIASATGGARVVSPAPGSRDGIYVQNASHLILEGFVVDGSAIAAYGIGFHDALPTEPMRDVTVRNNVVEGAGSTDIYLSQLADSLVEGNVAVGSRGSHGIYLANAGSDNTTLRGNLCRDNAVNGIHFNGDLAETGDGLQRGLLVEGNVIYGNGANGLNMDGVQDSVVRNNLVFGNGHHALRAYAIDGADGPRSLVIVNNTFVGNRGWAVKLTDDHGGHVIFNNILLSAAGSIVIDQVDVVSDHNLVGGAFSLDGERTVLPLSAWQAAGYDRSSRGAAAEELFVSLAQRRFDLRPGSPAIDAGTFVLAGQLAPETDLAGRPRPAGGGYDVGAFEYVPEGGADR